LARQDAPKDYSSGWSRNSAEQKHKSIGHDRLRGTEDLKKSCKVIDTQTFEASLKFQQQINKVKQI
jgi:hypothetical protein